MRPLLHSVLGGALIGALVGGCSTKQGTVGSDGGAQGGAAAGTDAGKAGAAGSAGATAGASSSGAGGKAGSGTGGTGNGSSGGKPAGGNGAEGGNGAGTSGDGSGGTAAGTGGTGPCDSVESLEECAARTDCHSVFEDPQVCGCAAVGCCARFARCADNERADCTGANVDCEAMVPHCEAPAYVVSYSGFCYEGCVTPQDCAPSPPTPCPPSVPVNGSACGGDTQCYYDACPEGGRAIATCSGRIWEVETGTSCTVECSGVGEQCGEGEICLVHAGGALLVDCIENGCGTGPILEECAGNCPVFFSLYGGTTATCNTCPEGNCP